MAADPSAFSRKLIGYRTEAVHESIAYLERFYQAEKLAMSAHLWDVVRSLEHLKTLADTAGAIRTAVVGPERKESVPGAMAGGGEEPRPVPVPTPKRPSLSLQCWGYSRTEVDQFLAGLCGRCEGELDDLMRQTTVVEAQRSRLLVRLGESLQHVKSTLERPAVQPAVSHAAPGRVVPLRRQEGGNVPDSGVRAAWRPGAVEEGESLLPPLYSSRRADERRASLRIASGVPAEAPAGVLAGMPVGSPVELTGGAAPATLSPPEEQLRQGLAGRFQGLYQRFLAGKATGADLSAPDGELLAVRGTAITPDLVQRAEQAGVLASLIANMTLPEWTGDN